MAIFRINVRDKTLFANTDVFQTTDIVNKQYINVLDNDTLGVTPTNITYIDPTGFTLGTLTIELDNTVGFTPNGNIGTSLFYYTITDNINRTSTATVYVTTIEE